MGWEAGFSVQAAVLDTEGVVVVGDVPGHLQDTAEVPLSMLPNLPKAQIGSCDELATRPWVYSAFAGMQLG